jgi:hypothetical protein
MPAAAVGAHRPDCRSPVESWVWDCGRWWGGKVTRYMITSKLSKNLSCVSRSLGVTKGHNIRGTSLLCFSLLGFFLPKKFISLTCGHVGKFEKDESHPDLLFFRVPIIFSVSIFFSTSLQLEIDAEKRMTPLQLPLDPLGSWRPPNLFSASINSVKNCDILIRIRKLARVRATTGGAKCTGLARSPVPLVQSLGDFVS